MLLSGHIKSAIASLRSARWRSLLTMLGIIIGIVSVVTTVSLGEGVKKQVENQIEQRGENLVTILPGKRVQRDSKGQITSISSVFSQNNILFTEGDYRTISSVPAVGLSVPFGQVVGLVEAEPGEYPEAQVIAATADVPEALNQKLQFGSFYTDDDPLDNGAVIGKRVAERLFKENVPMGKAFTIRGQEFRVRGIFEEFVSSSPLLPGGDYNSAIFIPYRKGQELMGGNLQIYQILARPKDERRVNSTITSITAALAKQRGGQEDFTILRQDESLALTGNIVRLLTSLVASIAAISLVVGGIGIMNIMLVAVSERTNEIGVRKAVGATNRQILSQFLIEATVLSFVGGVLGVLFSILTNFILRITTDLQPVITLPVVLIATGVALAVGIFFGMMPALKAARKNPIDALRYE